MKDFLIEALKFIGLCTASFAIAVLLMIALGAMFPAAGPAMAAGAAAV